MLVNKVSDSRKKTMQLRCFCGHILCWFCCRDRVYLHSHYFLHGSHVCPFSMRFSMVAGSIHMIHIHRSYWCNIVKMGSMLHQYLQSYFIFLNRFNVTNCLHVKIVQYPSTHLPYLYQIKQSNTFHDRGHVTLGCPNLVE